MKEIFVDKEWKEKKKSQLGSFLILLIIFINATSALLLDVSLVTLAFFLPFYFIGSFLVLRKGGYFDSLKWSVRKNEDGSIRLVVQRWNG